MKVCNVCGSQVADQYTTCPNCGSTNLTVQNNAQPQMNVYQQPVGQPVYNQPVQNQKGNIGWGILGFFVPIVGLILYLVWKDSKPGDSKVAGMGALIGFGITFLFNVISIIF